MPAPRHTVPPVARTWSTACWMVSVLPLWDSAVTQTEHPHASPPPPLGGEKTGAARLGGAGPEGPLVHRVEDAARRRDLERHLHAVLEHHEGRARRRHRDDAAAGQGVYVGDRA